MNHVSITNQPAVPFTDQPMWPDLDIFDLTALSSPPSWVSGSASVESPNLFANLTCDQTVSSDRVLTALIDPSDSQEQDSVSAKPLTLFTKPDHLQFASYSDLIPLTLDSPVPDADAIVDKALELPLHSSPVLSDFPALEPQQASVLTPAALTQSSAMHNQLVWQTVPAPLDRLQQPQPAPHHATPTCSSSAVDSLSTHASSCPSPKSLRRSVLPVKEATSVPGRTGRVNVTGRVQKQTRRYSAPKSSRYCHLCARHQRCVEMVPCGNVELGLCQKSVCRKCIVVYKLVVTGPSWSCPHCQNNCPQRAKCFAYDRQTARRREKTLRAKLNGINSSNSRQGNRKQ